MRRFLFRQAGCFHGVHGKLTALALGGLLR
jgi:hypothetical protein